MSETHSDSQDKNLGRELIDPTGKKKIILAIDGGGMRGTITLAMLAELEDQLEQKYGKKISSHDLFDMFVGTSTGAIIAAGLAVGYSAKELLEEKKLYSKLLPEAFGKKSFSFWIVSILFSLIIIGLVVVAIACLYSLFIEKLLNNILAAVIFLVCAIVLGYLAKLIIPNTSKFIFVLQIISNGFRFAYPLESFLSQLKPLIEEKSVYRLSDITDKVLLTTAKDTLTGETAFIVNVGEGAEERKFKDWPIAAAVASSAAAPIFFPPVVNRFVDGGVSPYNNPCLMAAIEAIEYIGKYAQKVIAMDESDKITAQKELSKAQLQELSKYKEGGVILISLGTGYPPDETTTDKVAKKTFLDWMIYIMLEGIDDSLNQQVYLTRRLYGPEDSRSDDPEKQSGKIDFRRLNPSLAKGDVEKLLGQASTVNSEELGLDSFREKEVALMTEIGKHYAKKIDWSRSNTLPWDFEGGQPDPRSGQTGKQDWTGTDYDTGN